MRARGPDPLGRGQLQALAHAIAHQYAAEPWLTTGGQGRKGEADQAGYWAVEGLARFIEDQVVELGRADRRVSDPMALSVVATAQADAAGKLLPIERFVDMTREDFDGLSRAPIVEVRPEGAAAPAELSERDLFYEQAGSLVFFMLHRRGELGRAAMVEYLRNWYTEYEVVRGWELLGFESAEELEEGLRAFLREVPR